MVNQMRNNVKETKESTLASSMINEGSFVQLSSFQMKESMHQFIRQCFLDGIEKLAGSECKNNVQEEGLSRMHKFFPPEKVGSLQEYVNEAAKEKLYTWAGIVGEKDLGLDQEFWIDELIVVRINYPYAVARKAKKQDSDQVKNSKPLNSYLTDLADPATLAKKTAKKIGITLLNMAGDSESVPTTFNPYKYHHNLPKVAHSHGPHVDTWYGHSFDGLNLWWGIEGVTEENGMILYPDLAGIELKPDPEHMYLAPGIELTKPYKVVLEDGELFVFNSEILHGTQVNISDLTRIAISTRINPEKPRFFPEAHWNVERWYSSKDIAQGNFKVQNFSAKGNAGEPRKIKTKPFVQRHVVVKLQEKLHDGLPIVVSPSGTLADGQKMLIELADAKVIIVRNSNDIFAFGALCPHLGINLIDGFHEGNQIFCPGHGLEFNVSDGSSGCEAMKLKTYKVFENDGTIYLQT